MYKFLPLLLLSLIAVSCNNEKRPTAETGEAAAAPTGTGLEDAVVYQLEPSASTLIWEGYEGISLGNFKHQGSVQITEGTISVKNKAPVAGKFTIDIQSLKVEDIPYNDPGNAKLTRHLLGEDFFDAVKFPKAFFEITGANPVRSDSLALSGNLTIRGVTKNITIPASVQVSDGTLFASTPKFFINRKDWGMFYRSEESLGDDLIRPEIGITLSITAKEWKK